MRATRIFLGLFVALLALTACDGTTPQDPLQESPPPALLVLEAVTPVSTTGIVGEELAAAPVVLVKQRDGLPVAGIQVSFVVNGSGSVSRATVVTDAAGLATPGTWRLGPGSGLQTLTAHAAGRSLVFTADARPGLLQAMTPVRPAGMVGEELDVDPAVLVTQGDGLPLEGVRVSFVVSGSGFVGNATAMTDAAGMATPGTWRLGPGAGPQTLIARAVGRTLVFIADAQPGPITSLSAVGGNGQWAAAGTLLPAPLRVKATDGYGNGVTGAEVTFAVVDGGGSVAPGAAITGAQGIAESRWTLGTTAGRQHVRAQTGGANAQFIADACQPGSNFELAYVFEGNIFVFDGATCGIRPLTGDGLSNEPAWSPDGARIAFVRHDPLLNGIYVMNSDGSGVTRVAGAGQSPTWSPQGDALAFTSCTPECGLYVQELSDGSVPRRIAEGGIGPAWSPDGSRIALFRFHGELIPGDDTPFHSLLLVNADGSGATEIVPVTANMEGATWSPDGTRIAFSVNSDIYLVHADGSGLTRRTTYAGAQRPAWSPDGTRIAFDQWSPDTGTRIMAIPVAGGEPEMLVPSGWSAAWRPHR